MKLDTSNLILKRKFPFFKLPMKLSETRKQKKPTPKTRKSPFFSAIRSKALTTLLDNLGIVDSPDTRESFEEETFFSSQVFGKRFSSKNLIQRIPVEENESEKVLKKNTGTINDLDVSELVHIFKFCCPYEILDFGIVNLPFLKASLEECLWEFHTKNTFLVYEKCVQGYFDLIWKPTFFIHVNNERLKHKGKNLTQNGRKWVKRLNLFQLLESV